MKKEIFTQLSRTASHANVLPGSCYKQYKAIAGVDENGGQTADLPEWSMKETSKLSHKWPEYVAPSRPTNRGKECKYSYKVSLMELRTGTWATPGLLG